MQLSIRQEAILETWDNSTNNLLISATAGSGKTFILFELLKKCEYKTLFVAFNKTIQEEIQGRLDAENLRQGKAMTMHSLGLTAIRATGKRFNINNSKNWGIIKKVQQKHRNIFRNLRREDQLKISYNLIDIDEVSRMFLTNDLEVIKECMLTMDKVIFENSYTDALWESFLEFREEGYNQNVLEIDFSDMIYLPIIKNWDIPVHPYYLFIDEAQDLSVAQHKLIDNLIDQGAVQRWVATGDPNQAIYGFAGSSSDSFNKFLEKPGATVELPLDICYRCAKGIVSFANDVYPVMTAAKPYPGIVENKNLNDLSSIKPNSMIICRNTAPLFAVYFKLLSLGKPCYINGNDIMGYLVKFLKPYVKNTIHSADREMQYKMAEFEEQEESSAQAYFFKENYNNFKNISMNMCRPTDSIESLLDRLKQLFVNKKDAIMLCTIHKSKGLEADVVYILNESLIPSKFAKSKEQLKQEKNLKYVARTRAKEEMYFLNIKIEDGAITE